ncbi:MAG: alginate O-acetyltransferase AlgX-related protein [Myxococcota bacterium]
MPSPAETDMPSPAETDMPSTPPAPSRLALVPGILFGLLQLFLLSLGIRALQWPAEGLSVLKGAWTAEVEILLNQHVETRTLGVAFWSSLEFVIGQTGRKGVLVGSDGWLFSSEEFEQHPDETERLAEKARLVLAINTYLHAREITLMVALLPSKSRVYHTHLGRYHVPAYAARRYEHFRQTLEAGGLQVPDLYATLEAGKAETPMFLRTDTHWTPAGAQRVAQKLAEQLREKPFPGLSQTVFRAEPSPELEVQGDLLAFLPVSPWSGFDIRSERIQPLRAVPPPTHTSAALFGDASIPVVLVGTSYSVASHGGFADALKLELGAEVLNVAQEGRGPILPMLTYLENAAFRETPPSVIVWELPERYLPRQEDWSMHAELLQTLGLMAPAGTGG